MPIWESVKFGRFKKQCEHKIEFGLTRAYGSYHCGLLKPKLVYCSSSICKNYPPGKINDSDRVDFLLQFCDCVYIESDKEGITMIENRSTIDNLIKIKIKEYT